MYVPWPRRMPPGTSRGAARRRSRPWPRRTGACPTGTVPPKDRPSAAAEAEVIWSPRASRRGGAASGGSGKSCMKSARRLRGGARSRTTMLGKWRRGGWRGRRRRRRKRGGQQQQQVEASVAAVRAPPNAPGGTPEPAAHARAVEQPTLGREPRRDPKPTGELETAPMEVLSTLRAETRTRASSGEASTPAAPRRQSRRRTGESACSRPWPAGPRSRQQRRWRRRRRCRRRLSRCHQLGPSCGPLGSARCLRGRTCGTRSNLDITLPSRTAAASHSPDPKCAARCSYVSRGVRIRLLLLEMGFACRL